VAWDAWRREDGRWTLSAAFSTAERSGTATFSFDVRGNYVTVDDSDARWLIGDDPVRPGAAPARDDLQAARERRRGGEREDLGSDAIELVTAPPPRAGAGER
jgi:hypothetical protein